MFCYSAESPRFALEAVKHYVQGETQGVLKKFHTGRLRSEVQPIKRQYPWGTQRQKSTSDYFSRHELYLPFFPES